MATPEDDNSHDQAVEILLVLVIVIALCGAGCGLAIIFERLLFIL